MNFKITAVILATSLISLTAEESVTLKSKKGKKIEATIISNDETGVTVVRADGKEFTIPFATLDESSVTLVKTKAAEAIAAAEAKEMEEKAAAAAEEARIPKFPEAPKSPAELPQKIIFSAKEGASALYTLAPVKGFFVEPTAMSDDDKEKPHLKIATSVGDGVTMISFSQTLTESLTVKFMYRSKEGDDYDSIEEVVIPKTESKGGRISLGSSKMLHFTVSEIVVFDFRSKS